MTLDKEEHRELLLSALKGIGVQWTLDKAAEAFKSQTSILELADSIRSAKVLNPEDGAKLGNKIAS